MDISLKETKVGARVTICTDSVRVMFLVVFQGDNVQYVRDADLQLTGTTVGSVHTWLKRTFRDGTPFARKWDCVNGEAESACRIWTRARFAITDWVQQ